MCFDPYRVYEHCKLQYDEMKTLVVDNFVSMVNARKFMLGDMPDYSVVNDATHNYKGKSLDVCTNLCNSASIYLPWNKTVAVTLTWNLNVLSKYFAIFPLVADTMGNNILYNISWYLCQEEGFSDLHFDRLSLTKVRNEASGNNLDDRFGVHMENLRLLDTVYGLGNIDYVCLKVLGCHHPQYNDDQKVAFGLNVGGYFLPCGSSDCEKNGFQLEPESDILDSDTTSDDDFMVRKVVTKRSQGK